MKLTMPSLSAASQHRHTVCFTSVSMIPTFFFFISSISICLNSRIVLMTLFHDANLPPPDTP